MGMVSQIWPMGNSLPTPAIEYRFQKVQCRDNLIIHQSLLPMLKGTKLCYKVRIEKRILNQLCRDKSRGRVIGLILQVPQTTRIFFFSSMGMNAINFFMQVIFLLAIDDEAETEGEKEFTDVS